MEKQNSKSEIANSKMAGKEDQRKVIKQEYTSKVKTMPRQVLTKRISSYRSSQDVKDEDLGEDDDFRFEKEEYYSDFDNSEALVKQEEEQMWGNDVL